ncbi:hypothetical protein PX52LOC_06674 [Limnoglobus roseus]|uniref:Uncharacterized protein n=1 Tax=Limnoglobus roseus TaxID=2598579 RepID=A0A5C1ARU7_9BACT|nr:hypothetical protein [Limnoglobus roseus]QEL19598.1 hypothetical protein PX52LOC_06674 [Limnoglobus roseus]
MNHPAIVGVGQPERGVPNVTNGRVRGQWADRLHEPPQVAAFEVAGDEVGNSVILAGVKRGHHVRVRQLRGQFDLAGEPPVQRLPVGGVMGDDLQCDQPVHPPVSRQVDHAHPTRPDRPRQFVLPQHRRDRGFAHVLKEANEAGAVELGEPRREFVGSKPLPAAATVGNLNGEQVVKNRECVGRRVLDESFQSG